MDSTFQSHESRNLTDIANTLYNQLQSTTLSTMDNSAHIKGNVSNVNKSQLDPSLNGTATPKNVSYTPSVPLVNDMSNAVNNTSTLPSIIKTQPSSSTNASTLSSLYTFTVTVSSPKPTLGLGTTVSSTVMDPQKTPSSTTTASILSSPSSTMTITSSKLSPTQSSKLSTIREITTSSKEVSTLQNSSTQTALAVLPSLISKKDEVIISSSAPVTPAMAPALSTTTPPPLKIPQQEQTTFSHKQHISLLPGGSFTTSLAPMGHRNDTNGTYLGMDGAQATVTPLLLAVLLPMMVLIIAGVIMAACCFKRRRLKKQKFYGIEEVEDGSISKCCVESKGNYLSGIAATYSKIDLKKKKSHRKEPEDQELMQLPTKSPRVERKKSIRNSKHKLNGVHRNSHRNSNLIAEQVYNALVGHVETLDINENVNNSDEEQSEPLLDRSASTSEEKASHIEGSNIQLELDGQVYDCAQRDSVVVHSESLEDIPHSPFYYNLTVLSQPKVMHANGNVARDNKNTSASNAINCDTIYNQVPDKNDCDTSVDRKLTQIDAQQTNTASNGSKSKNVLLRTSEDAIPIDNTSVSDSERKESDEALKAKLEDLYDQVAQGIYAKDSCPIYDPVPLTDSNYAIYDLGAEDIVKPKVVNNAMDTVVGSINDNDDSICAGIPAAIPIPNEPQHSSSDDAYNEVHNQQDANYSNFRKKNNVSKDTMNTYNSVSGSEKNNASASSSCKDLTKEQYSGDTYEPVNEENSMDTSIPINRTSDASSILADDHVYSVPADALSTDDTYNVIPDEMLSAGVDGHQSLPNTCSTVHQPVPNMSTTVPTNPQLPGVPYLPHVYDPVYIPHSDALGMNQRIDSTGYVRSRHPHPRVSQTYAEITYADLGLSTGRPRMATSLQMGASATSGIPAPHPGPPLPPRTQNNNHGPALMHRLPASDPPPPPPNSNAGNLQQAKELSISSDVPLSVTEMEEEAEPPHTYERVAPPVPPHTPQVPKRLESIALSQAEAAAQQQRATKSARKSPKSPKKLRKNSAHKSPALHKKVPPVQSAERMPASPPIPHRSASMQGGIKAPPSPQDIPQFIPKSQSSPKTPTTRNRSSQRPDDSIYSVPPVEDIDSKNPRDNVYYVPPQDENAIYSMPPQDDIYSIPPSNTEYSDMEDTPLSLLPPPVPKRTGDFPKHHTCTSLATTSDQQDPASPGPPPRAPPPVLPPRAAENHPSPLWGNIPLHDLPHPRSQSTSTEALDANIPPDSTSSVENSQRSSQVSETYEPVEIPD